MSGFKSDYNGHYWIHTVVVHYISILIDGYSLSDGLKGCNNCNYATCYTENDEDKKQSSFRKHKNLIC